MGKSSKVGKVMMLAEVQQMVKNTEFINYFRILISNDKDVHLPRMKSGISGALSRNVMYLQLTSMNYMNLRQFVF